MSLAEILGHCLPKTGVTETFPFGPDTLVLKVFGKIFLLINIDNPTSLNLKCDPELAIELREKYDFILPGYHMNKKHWNTIMLNGNFSKKELWEWIDHSYDLVFNNLPFQVKQALKVED